MAGDEPLASLSEALPQTFAGRACSGARVSVFLTCPVSLGCQSDVRHSNGQYSPSLTVVFKDVDYVHSQLSALSCPRNLPHDCEPTLYFIMRGAFTLPAIPVAFAMRSSLLAAGLRCHIPI